MGFPSLKHEDVHRLSSNIFSSTQYRDWILLGYLTCPSVLVEPMHLEWLQTMLRDGWVLHVSRDDLVVTTHGLWQEMFSWYPKKKSDVKFPKGVQS